MHFNISTNLYNGAGLQRDFELLKRMLEAAGHSVHGIMFNDYTATSPRADVTIFIEIINPLHIFKGSKVWFIPNSEWFLRGFEGTLQYVHKVICKTRDCFQIWSKKVGEKNCVYIGWEALDLYDPSVERKRTFLHVAGKSATKNSKAVLDAWRLYNLPFYLTVLAWHPYVIPYCERVHNVKHIVRAGEEELKQLMNENIFHIMPSEYEGFGMAFHEGLGCGAIMITVNAPPMNEAMGALLSGVFVAPSKVSKRMEAPAYSVSPESIVCAVNDVSTFQQQDLDNRQRQARTSFESDRDNFRTAFARLIDA